MKTYLKFVWFSLAVISVTCQDIDECLQQDSISCIQKSLYRKAKEFFGKENIELVGGVSLVKSAERSSKSGSEVLYDQEINAANDAVQRQNALENFVGDEANEFLTGRSLRINFAPAFNAMGQTARALADSVPTEVKEAVNEVVEGRGKKKHLTKLLMPILALVKAKIVALATVATFAIALVAKKAIFASLLSLAFSIFFGLKSLWAKGGSGFTAYNSGNTGGWAAPAPSAGWSSVGGSGSWEDGHGFSGQNQPFSGYH